MSAILLRLVTCDTMRVVNHLLRTIWLLPLAAWLLFGCQLNQEDPTPIFITEVVQFDDGREVILTIEVTPTPNILTPSPEPTIPVERSVVTLDIATNGLPGELDPQRPGTELTNLVTNNVYAGLTRIDLATDDVIGELAYDWQISEAGRIWTFDLRDDIYWVQASVDDGFGFGSGRAEADVNVVQIRPISAEDIVFAIRRACNRNTGTSDASTLFLIEGCQQVYSLPNPEEEELATIGVRAISDTRLEVRLTRPAAWFLSMTALPVFRPIPADYFQDEEVDWLDTETIYTSGPFIYSPLTDLEAEPRAVVTLEQNPFWPENLRNNQTQSNFEPVERINLHRYNSSAESLVAFENSEIDMAPLPSSEVEEAVAPPARRPPLVTRNEVYFLGFNLDSPAFGIPEVRYAFNAAIDRDKLLRDVYGREGLAMQHFAPPGVLHAPPFDEVGIGFSPDLALFQMTNSGYSACRAIGSVRYLINATDSALRHAESLIEMWVDELGCDANQFEIEQVKFGELLSRTRADAGANRPDIWDLGWVSVEYDVHDWYASVIHCRGGENRPKRPCSEIDDLIDQAAITFDKDARTALYREIENGLFGNNGWAPFVPLYAGATYQLEQNWIRHISDDDAGDFVRSGLLRFDEWQVNQLLKDLEQSQ